MDEPTVVVVGGTHGLGRDLARHYAELGRTVTISGRDIDRARAAAGSSASALAPPPSTSPIRPRSSRR